MQRLQKERIKNFVLGGNATITIESGVTGKHFTYKITQHKEDKDLFFIKLLRGCDNENDYSYIGCWYNDNKHFHPCKDYAKKDLLAWPKSIRAIRYLLIKLDDVPDNLYVYHEGRCCRCGRKLTTPESIEKGIGPECEKLS